MRRSVGSVFVAAALVALAVTTVLAAPPVGACPNPRFEAMTYAEFRALSVEVGVPEALLGPEHLARFATFDRNDDGLVCFMDLPDNAGTFYGWVFNAIDNAAHPR